MAQALQQVLNLLDSEISRPGSRVAIVSHNGAADESSLLATRDGYLRLARTLVAFVQAAAGGESERDPETGAWWSDAVSSVFHSLTASSECDLVGAHLCAEHCDLMVAMRRFLADGSCHGLENDPDFSEPALVRRPGDK